MDINIIKYFTVFRPQSHFGNPSFTLYSTDTAGNSEITPGKTVTIAGKKIRIVPEEGETVANCITWTNLDTQQVIEQEDAPVVNDPTKIILQLPELTPGQYSLTVKTLFSMTGTNLKAPRYISSKTNLYVSQP